MTTEKQKPYQWKRMEPGWYVAVFEGRELGIGVAKEEDGQWHLYIGGYASPGDSHSAYKTLAAAKAAAWEHRQMALYPE